MAQTPSRVTWSESAFSTFQGLSSQDRQAVLKRIEMLRNHPQMYQLEPTGRWAGLRRFIAGSWVVFYGHWASENAVYVEAILRARSDRR